jgi:anti-sigma factor ChrR (cupin superfamily)
MSSTGVHVQEVNAYREMMKEKGKEVSEYDAIQALAEEQPHPRSDHMADDVIAALPQWEQDRIKAAKAKRARRAERARKLAEKEKAAKKTSKKSKKSK